MKTSDLAEQSKLVALVMLANAFLRTRLISTMSRLVLLSFAIVVFASSFTLFYASPQSTQAAISNTPTENFTNTNGQVTDMVSAPDGSVYIGGGFTAANPDAAVLRGGGINVNDGSVSRDFQANSTIYVVISDGAGGWYIGGEFTQIAGVARNRLAHIMSDGSLDSNFDPNVGGGRVVTLALDTANNTLYAGGLFSSVNGSTPRNRLAAFDVTNGVATSFNPNMNNVVLSIVLDAANSTLYVGGYFTTTGVTSRLRIAAFNTTTGVVTAFNPRTNASGVTSLALDTANSTLYAGGTFTTVNGSITRNNLASFSTTTGTVTAFNPNINTTVSALTLDTANSTLYAGGGFTTVNGSTTRNRLAAFDVTTGTATSFDPNISSGNVNALTLDTANSTLYAGGSFIAVNNLAHTRNYFAAFNTATSLVTSFDLNVNSSILALNFDASTSTLYAGGQFTTIGGVLRNRLLRINPDGTLDETFNPRIGGTVNALALDAASNTLYVGGIFTTVNGGTITRSRLAAIDTITGIATSFDPNLSGGGGTVNALALDTVNDILYVGGGFTTVNGGTARNNLASFSTATGVATVFNPNISSSVSTIELDTANSTLYAGGGFTTVNGSTTRNRLAAFDVTTGTATSFDPNMNSTVNALALDAANSTLYSAGFFTTVNGGSVTRSGLAAFDVTTGTATSFDPNINGYAGTIDLDTVNNILYAGGSFTTVNGSSTNRNNLASFSTATGVATAFSPSTNYIINSIVLDATTNTLYTGTFYNPTGDQLQTALFAFTDPDLDNDSIPNTVEQAAPNSGDANNDATPDSQQPNVTSLVNSDTNEYVTVTTPPGTTLSTTTAIAAPDETDYTHLFGLTGFTVTGVTPGDTVDVNIFYPNPDNYDPTSFTARKYFPATTSYQTITGATITATTIDNHPVIRLAYQLTDGGTYDLDNTVDGTITDPASLAVLGTNTTPPTLQSGAESGNTGLANTGQDVKLFILIAVVLLTLAIYKTRKAYTA